MTDASGSALLQQIVSGESAELRRLAAEGLVPLALEDLLGIQIVLAEDADEEISSLAASSLADADPQVVASFLTEGQPTEEVLWFFATNAEHPLVLGAVVDQRRTPPGALEEVAPRLPADLQERLLLRQDAIVERPGILDALEANGRVSSFAIRRIAEYRRHLLRTGWSAERSGAVPVPAEEEGIETPRVRRIRSAFEHADELDQVDPHRLQTAQIRRLTVPERVALCKAAPRALRIILIRDQHPVVAESVMRFNRLTEDEVEQIARSRTVIDAVLESIARDRTWIRRTPIVDALVRNPKTPVGVTMKLLSRLQVRSLKEIARDRNLPEAVRSRARQLYTIKLR